MSEEETQKAVSQQSGEGIFEIKKIFIKDLSFESPISPAVFTDGEWKPEVNVQINSANKPGGQDVYEVVLTITITVKQKDKTAFLVEIQQAGVFIVKGYPDDALNGILGAYCLETLFPYAREAIDSLVIKGGFPPLMLNAVNFNAIYQQQLEANKAAGSEQAVTH